MGGQKYQRRAVFRDIIRLSPKRLDDGTLTGSKCSDADKHAKYLKHASMLGFEMDSFSVVRGVLYSPILLPR